MAEREYLKRFLIHPSSALFNDDELHESTVEEDFSAIAISDGEHSEFWG